MKVAIACDEDVNGPQVSKVFARCARFALYDPDIDLLEYVDNPYRKIKDHAGEESIRFLAGKGIRRIIGYDFGYKVRKITGQYLMQLIVPGKEHLPVSDVVNMLKETSMDAGNNL